MKYLCLVYIDERKFDDFTTADQVELDREALAYDDELRLSGHYVMANALDSVAAAVTVRVENGTATVIDGPFAETKEHLGGFIMIEARDLNDAIRVASRIPPGRMGCIEIRPVKEISPN